MTQQSMSVSDQLKAYADEIDPSTSDDLGWTANRSHRSRLRNGGLVAAAAAVLLGVLAFTVLRPDNVQTVETTEVAAQRPTEPPEGSQDAAAPITYLIAEGDTTSGIAFRYNVTRDELVAANPWMEGGMSIGDEVLIPLQGGRGEFRLDGDRYWLTREEQLVVELAQSTLVSECLDKLGLTFPSPTDDELIAAMGDWQPSGVLGIGRAGAARSLGYRSAPPIQERAFEQLNQLSGDKQHELVTAQERCWQQIRETLGRDESRRSDLSNALFGVDETQGERWRSDLNLEQAIAAWQTCINAAVGVEADTPNTLARQFAFSEEPASDREREIAVADVDCQRQSDLERIFYETRTVGLAEELGGRAHLLNEYGALTEQLLARATAVLADRSITPPSLD